MVTTNTSHIQSQLPDIHGVAKHLDFTRRSQNICTMGIFNLSPNETHREKQTNDIERGSDETVKHSGNQVSSDVTPYEARFDQQNHDIERGSDKVTKHKAHKFSLDAYSTSPPYHATVMYEAMYHSLMFTPWILSTILREKLTYPTIRGSPSQRGVSASSIAGGLTAIVLGAAIEAPLAAGAACLHNVTGSWLMRMHHSHDDFAFHGGSAQGNYALAGALSMLPAMAMLVMARPRFDAIAPDY